MQNRYVGDIGDFEKMAILRALCGNKRLGVAWWLYPDEDHNADGRHIGYLQQRERWRLYDADLFDRLCMIVDAGGRRVSELEAANLLPNAIYWNAEVPTTGLTVERRMSRQSWFEAGRAMLTSCDVVFADPDNGLETKNFDPGARKAGKSISIAELKALDAPGRALIVYHHQTRMAGGHHFELEHWGGRLREAGFNRVDALRASPFSARAFFLLNADDEMRDRAMHLSTSWGDRLTWHSTLGA